MFLTHLEVANLTGRKLPKCQCEQLRQQGIRHTRDAAGRVVVLIAEVERALTSSLDRRKGIRMPNLEALDGAAAKNS